MKQYQGLFILNMAGREEGLNEVVDRLAADINAAGGKVEKVQKLDKRLFARLAPKRLSGGHYVNVVFEAGPTVVASLQEKFQGQSEVLRVLFTEGAGPEVKEEVAAA